MHLVLLAILLGAPFHLPSFPDSGVTPPPADTYVMPDGGTIPPGETLHWRDGCKVIICRTRGCVVDRQACPKFARPPLYVPHTATCTLADGGGC